MSGLPIMGEFNPMMMRMGQMSRSDPWIIVSELKKDFEVKEIQLQTEKIDDDVKVLIVIHPKSLSEKTQFAIDQFVLRGGKLLAFLDPLSIVDMRNQPGQNQLQAAASATGSTLDKLLKAHLAGARPRRQSPGLADRLLAQRAVQQRLPRLGHLRH